ncbi:uncharacterized protein PHACADRAFT_254157, partial [Phanerochaete carnosa HHB-10118-sp]
SRSTGSSLRYTTSIRRSETTADPRHHNSLWPRPCDLRQFIMANVELAATYAALILADDGVEITSDKITALMNAANAEVEAIWATLLAKALEGKNVKELLSNVGAGGGAPAAGGASATAGGAAAGGAEAPKEEEKKKEEEKEESDDDMGFGLFD